MSIKSVLRELIQSDINFEELDISQETLEEIELLKCKYNKPELTEQSREVLKFIKDNFETTESFTCKDVGDKMLESPRSISGSLQKITRLGYVEKTAGKPTSYRLTESGKNVTI